ncbi:MAG: flagellar biosynthetic protein FliR [Acetobacteraceae bacterium]
MTQDDAALIAGLPALAFAFVLVLARAGGVVMLLPGLAETGVPAMVRAGVAGAVALLLTPIVAPLVPNTPAAPAEAAAMVIAELIAGLWLGFLARVLALALPMAGQVLAYLLGLSSVLVPDPEMGPGTTGLGRLFALAAPALVLASGLYALPAGVGAESVARMVAVGFGLALRLCAPALLASIVWSVAAGLMARAAPRVQVYFLAMPAQILGGLALLAVLSAAMLAAWQDAVRAGFGALPGLN